jgi:hypothetical protein
MNAQATRKTKRRPPASFFAMGRAEAAEEIIIEGLRYRFVRLFKHDFFAMTVLYEVVGEEGEVRGQAVLKIQRAYPFFGFPLRWLGRLVAGHEIDVYERLQGVRGIPRFLGRVGKTGFLHEFIPGEDLHGKLPLTPAFFVDLEALFKELHARHIAYVDSNKRENILFGADGRPWLIDFQISFALKKWQEKFFWARWAFRRLARSDWYHFYKHKTRLLPAACSAEDFVLAKKRGALHQMHRMIARPLILMRRRFLSRYDLANTR